MTRIVGQGRWCLGVASTLGVSTVALGCPPSEPPPLPEVLTGLESTAVGLTTGDETSTGLGTTTGDAMSTGPSTQCGNGVLDEGEECDGPLGELTCESLGYVPGVLACSTCSIDASRCVPPRMVLVPGGEFTMGSNVSDDEMPIRIVAVDAFYIDELEVTVEDYTACVTDGICETPAMGGYYNYGVPERLQHPINGVSWEEATVCCEEWADRGGVKRLPTELGARARWEKSRQGSRRMEPVTWAATCGSS